MAKEKNDRQNEKVTAEDYYDLKTDAVEKLINAKDAPEVSEAELKKYRSKGGLSRVPTWLKIVFGKFWFSGAVCYFFLWGLGNYISDRLDLFAVTAVGLGVITDLILNHILRSIEPEERAYDRWVMVTTRKFWSLFLNVIYAALLMFCVYKTYYAANTMIAGDVNTADKVPIGVEPILFGLLYMGFDMFFIMLKNVFVKIFRDAEKKAAGSGKQ